ncbi:MAG: hypothetical protein WDM88_08520 [Galbitalea sp.]
MSSRLPAALSRRDLPAPELTALVLDGEAYRLDDCAAPIDQVAGPLLRAAVLAAELPARLIAEQHTAAWVWGALPQPPGRHEGLRRHHGAGAAGPRRAPERAGGRHPARRHRPALGRPRDDPRCARRSISHGSSPAGTSRRRGSSPNCSRWPAVSVVECARVMNRRRNLPNKRIAPRTASGLCGAADRESVTIPLVFRRRRGSAGGDAV